MRLHHVQVSMPKGREQEARTFYGEVLGLVEIDKPGVLAQRGGCWFRALGDDGSTTAEIHLGVEEPFNAARKAHPALAVESVDALERLGNGIMSAGYEMSWDERDTLDGFTRFHCRDPFGNRIELLTPRA